MTNPFAPAAAAQPAGNPFAAAAPAAPVAPRDMPQAAPPALADGDPFSGPAPQAARGPRLRDLYGRLLLIVPTKLEEGLPDRLNPGQTKDRMTADVIVLDGGPINYGGAPEKTPPMPHDKTAQVPHRTARQYIGQAGIISQSRVALANRAAGKPGMVLGRLGVGEQSDPTKSPPFILSQPTEEDKQIARAYLATVDPFA